MSEVIERLQKAKTISQFNIILNELMDEGYVFEILGCNFGVADEHD